MKLFNADSILVAGDIVEVEMRMDKVTPRFDFTVDSGATGIWIRRPIRVIHRSVNIELETKNIHPRFWNGFHPRSRLFNNWIRPVQNPVKLFNKDSVLNVGDVVEVEMQADRTTPRFDYSTDRGGPTGIWVEKTILGVNHRDSFVAFDTPIGKWTGYAPSHVKFNNWIRPVQTQAESIIEIEEEILYSRELIFFGGDHNIPSPVIQSIVDDGERWVRRNIRAWPFGKTLVMKTSDVLLGHEPRGKFALSCKTKRIFTWTWSS